MVVNTDVGLATADVSWVVPNITDNSGDFTITASHDPSYTFGIGITNVTYRAVDASGNEALYSFTVTVEGKFCFHRKQIESNTGKKKHHISLLCSTCIWIKTGKSLPYLFNSNVVNVLPPRRGKQNPNVQIQSTMAAIQHTKNIN